MQQRGSRAWVGALVVLVLGGIARSAVIMPVFGPASRVTELSAPQPYNDVPTWARTDGLRVLFHSNRNETGDQLFGATRTSIGQPFSAPGTAEFVNNNIAGHDVKHGVLSPNGLELFYADHLQSRTPQTLTMRATRATAASAFSAGTAVGALMVGTSPTYPSYLSPDGLRLYLFKPSEADAFVATRASVGGAFGAPSAAPFINVPNIHSPHLTPDELQLFFSISQQLWWTSRPSIGAAFDPPQALTSITGRNLDAPVFFNGDSLLFYDVFGSDTNGDIWQARIPEPIGITVLSVVVWGFIALRRRRST